MIVRLMPQHRLLAVVDLDAHARIFATAADVSAGDWVRPTRRDDLGNPCSDRPSERGRCGARLLLHWLGADPIPERALVIERDGGGRHQLVIACRL